MKLVRCGAPGAEKPGRIDASGRVRALPHEIRDIAGDAGLRASLARRPDIDALPRVDGTPRQELRLGPCVGAMGKVICIGLNPADHAAEAGMPIPPGPVIFNKWTSAIVGPNDAIQVPRGSIKTDWDVERGVVVALRVPIRTRRTRWTMSRGSA